MTVPRVFCIGRNYVAHARELNNEVPDAPVVFLKPATSLVPVGEAVRFPMHGEDLQNEAEVVIRIGREGRAHSTDGALSFVDGVTLGLDLTLRDVQSRLKAKGLPWEAAKAFDQSAPVGSMAAYDGSIDLHNLKFTCRVNGEVRQSGNTANMIFDIETLIVELSKVWILKPGDLIYTGTPEGVGPLAVGDRVEVTADGIGAFGWDIVA